METIEDDINGRLLRVTTALTEEPWLISPSAHARLLDIVQRHQAGGHIEAAQHAVAQEMGEKPMARAFRLDGKTAVVSVEGVIGRKFSNSLRSSGVVSIDVLDRILTAAQSDDEVESILMVFDSPGGSAMQVESVASHIKAIAKDKPVIAYADGLCCSAAYWLASQCNVLYAADYAHVGSIGVYLAVLDDESRGRVEMIQSGRFKGAGYPGTKMTQEQYDNLRKDVDKLGETFRSSVRSGRERDISDDVMQGQSFAVEEALANGLIDGVVSYSQALRDAGDMGQMRKGRK